MLLSRRWWTRLAGIFLIVDGITVALYSGWPLGPALWTSPVPIPGPIPVHTVVFATLPALSGIGILRGAGWARGLGIALVALYLWSDAFALASAATIPVAIEATTSLFVAFALARRWAPDTWRNAPAPPADG
jgi:hypothetical protein